MLIHHSSCTLTVYQHLRVYISLYTTYKFGINITIVTLTLQIAVLRSMNEFNARFVIILNMAMVRMCVVSLTVLLHILVTVMLLPKCLILSIATVNKLFVQLFWQVSFNLFILIHKKVIIV